MGAVSTGTDAAIVSPDLGRNRSKEAVQPKLTRHDDSLAVTCRGGCTLDDKSDLVGSTAFLDGTRRQRRRRHDLACHAPACD